MKKIFILCTLLLSCYHAQTHGMSDDFLLPQCAQENEAYLKGFKGCRECLLYTPRITRIDGDVTYYEPLSPVLIAHINAKHRSRNSYTRMAGNLDWLQCNLCWKMDETSVIINHLCPNFRPPIKALEHYPE